MFFFYLCKIFFSKMSYLTVWFWNDIWAAHVLREIHTKGTDNVHPKHDFSAVTSEPHTGGQTSFICELFSYLQTAGCWAADECVHQRGLSERRRDDGPHTARPPSRSSRLSRDASARRSEPPASPPSPPEARSPRQTRRAPESGLQTQNTSDGCSDWWLIRCNCWREMRHETRSSEICCVADDVWYFEKMPGERLKQLLMMMKWVRKQLSDPFSCSKREKSIMLMNSIINRAKYPQERENSHQISLIS